MKKSILIILSLFLAITLSAQDISSALRQAQARFESGNETGGIELVNKVLAKYPDNKEAKDLLAKFNQVIKDREIDAAWKIAQEKNTFEEYQTFRLKYPGSKYDDTASDNMAKKLADRFTVNSTYSDRTKAESYAKKAMTKDYIANKWKATMAKKTSTSSSYTSSTSSTKSYSSNNSTSYSNRTYSSGSSSYTSNRSPSTGYSSTSKYSGYNNKEKKVAFGLDLSADFDVLGEAYGISPGIMMRIGKFGKWINGVVGLKYAYWSVNSEYSWKYDSDPYRCKINSLTMPAIVNLNYLPGEWLDVSCYFGVGYEFNLASSGTYDYRSSGSWIIQMGFGGRHVDWRMYYRAFPSAYLTTMEDGFLGTSLTYYF
mgnify:FL=1